MFILRPTEHHSYIRGYCNYLFLVKFSFFNSHLKPAVLAPAHLICGKRLTLLPQAEGRHATSTRVKLLKFFGPSTAGNGQFLIRWSKQYLLDMRSAHRTKDLAPNALQKKRHCDCAGQPITTSVLETCSNHEVFRWLRWPHMPLQGAAAQRDENSTTRAIIVRFRKSH